MALETDKTSAKQKTNESQSKNESNKNSAAPATQEVVSNSEPTNKCPKKKG